MRQPPVIIANGDLAVNASSFARSIRTKELYPKTETVYLQAVSRFADFLKDKGMPQDVASIKREHVESFIEEPPVHKEGVAPPATPTGACVGSLSGLPRKGSY